MPSGKPGRVRLSVEFEKATAEYFKQLARERGTTVNGLIIDGLKIMRAFQQQKVVGRMHMGFVSDPTKLDAELILIS